MSDRDFLKLLFLAFICIVVCADIFNFYLKEQPKTKKIEKSNIKHKSEMCIWIKKRPKFILLDLKFII